MQSVALLAPPDRPLFSWAKSGTQFLPVSGHVTDRLFVTYRADARALCELVPAPFTLDTHEGYGFLSVCAVEIVGMGIWGTPRWLHFDNREFLYRLAVRYRGESTFITLRSDVSSRALAVLGRYFSHYRPQRAGVRLLRAGDSVRMECVTRDGTGDAVLEVDTGESAPSRSIFKSSDQASRFLLGMSFSADAVRGRVRIQPIEHSPWFPRFVPARIARFAFVNELERSLGTRFTFDSALAARDIDQTWKAARWM